MGGDGSAAQLLPAAEHPSASLTRMTYEAGESTGQMPYSVSGVEALARALDHIHLGWALVGWITRLPILRAVIQLVVDAVGGGPRRAASGNER